MVACQNDVTTHFSWHATQVNPYSIGLEMEQSTDGSLYEATIDATAQLVAFLCEQLGVQKQTAWRHDTNTPDARLLQRLDPERAGANCVGVLGHRNIPVYRSKDDHTLVATRGYGDPNDYVFEELVRNNGFERFDFLTGEDLVTWRQRQTALGIASDGIPGPKTRAALLAAGYPHGLWVK